MGRILINLKIIHLALLGGLVLGLFLLIQLDAGKESGRAAGQFVSLRYIVLGFALAAAGGSFFLPGFLLGKNLSAFSLEEILPAYQKAKIMQWALLEGATALNLVYYYLSGVKDNLYISALLVVILAYLGPSLPNLGKTCGLPDEKIQELENKIKADAENK